MLHTTWNSRRFDEFSSFNPVKPGIWNHSPKWCLTKVIFFIYVFIYFIWGAKPIMQCYMTETERWTFHKSLMTSHTHVNMIFFFLILHIKHDTVGFKGLLFVPLTQYLTMTRWPTFWMSNRCHCLACEYFMFFMWDIQGIHRHFLNTFLLLYFDKCSF